jgi:hypothetical protein
MSKESAAVSPSQDVAIEHINRLNQRRLYLDQRIGAKKNVGWETVYDESERDALTWALKELTQCR